MNVGKAIEQAIARAREHEALSTRKLRVRFYFHHGDYDQGLTIAARIAAQSPVEFEDQDGQGIRRIPWSKLDQRAGELTTLVDEAVAEVEGSVGVKARD